MKEFIIKVSQDEVDALIHASGCICGDPIHSMRKYTDLLWTVFFKRLGLNKTNPYDPSYRHGKITFNK